MFSRIYSFLGFFQGAKRIVSEWVNLDSEARQFTAKILGDEVNPQELVSPNQSQAKILGDEVNPQELVSPNQSQDYQTDNSLEEDAESKSEL